MLYAHFITFSNFCQLLERQLPGISLCKLFTQLFDAYLTECQVNLTYTQIRKWRVGDRAISVDYVRFYQRKEKFMELEDKIQEHILMQIEDMHLFQYHWQKYIWCADGISEEFQKELRNADKKNIATVLLFAMQQAILRSDISWL